MDPIPSQLPSEINQNVVVKTTSVRAVTLGDSRPFESLDYANCRRVNVLELALRLLSPAIHLNSDSGQLSADGARTPRSLTLGVGQNFTRLAAGSLPDVHFRR